MPNTIINSVVFKRFLWVVRVGLISIGVILLSSCSNGSELPTLVPTADVSLAQSVDPTAEPSPTATPEPAAIILNSPIDGLTIDFGQSIDLIVTASHPIGIRSINMTSNGHGIGTFQAVDQTSMEVNQPWTPNHAGFHHVVATMTSRDGQTISTEQVTIKVIDTRLLAELAPIFAEIEQDVTALRGLSPLEAVEPSLLSETELRQRLQAGFFFTEEEANRDILVLYAFGFTPRNYNLYDLTYRYLGESIAGFYDPTTDEFVIVSNDKEFDAIEKIYYAHEFMHALQDQHFSLGLITDANQGYESGMALRALAEGEATFVQAFYVDSGSLTQDEIVEIFNELINIRPTNNPDYYPTVLTNAFTFAYTTGSEFAAQLFAENGWDGLNAAWQNIPQSTEQIIHPDKYFAGDSPIQVTIPALENTLGDGWEQIEEAVFGEFFLREYLAQELNQSEVDLAATGWGGDLFTLYWHEESDEIVLVLRNVWDTQGDSNEFVNGYGSFADLRFGTQQQSQPDGATCWQSVDYVCLYQVGSESLVVRGPSLEVVSAVATEIYQ
jgi:hypothetical protein